MKNVGLIASSLALALCMTPTVAAQADDSTRAKKDLVRFMPELRTPDRIKSPPIASGRVEGRKGEPAAGALVILQAWPSAAELAKIPDGGRVPVSTVAKATTDAQGSYELKVDDPSLLKPYLDGDGRVDLEVVVPSVNGASTTAATTVIVADTVAGLEPLATPDGEGGAVLNLKAEQTATPAQMVALTEGESPRGVSYEVVQKVTSLGVRDMQIEHIASVNKNVQVAVTNQSGTFSDVGIGRSATSGSVGFSQAGKVSVKSESSASYSTQQLSGSAANFSTKYFRDVEYVLLQILVVLDSGSPAASSYTRWETRPSGYVGGGFRTSGHPVPSTPAANCSRLGYGVTMKLYTTKATTFSAGIEISGKIGTDLSAKSGRTSSQMVTFKNKSTSADAKVCGVTALPGKDNPGALVIR